MLPKLAVAGRGLALERGFEQAAKRDDEESSLAEPFLAAWEDLDQRWTPLLFLNSTSQETGRRFITAPVKLHGREFVDAWDLHALLGRDMPWSSAAHNSARFTYVSPPGLIRDWNDVRDWSEVGKAQAYVIDGGYFENFGATTLMQAARSAIAAIEEKYGMGAVEPVFLLISSDPGLNRATSLSGARRTGNAWLERKHRSASIGSTTARVCPLHSEVIGPIAGLLEIRGAHGGDGEQGAGRLRLCLERSRTGPRRP